MSFVSELSTTPLDRSRLSVVVPVHNECGTLPELLRRIVAVVARLDFESSEIIIVDDGSTDGTPQLLREAAAQGRIRAVFLTRNFGHQAALWTGIEVSRGSVVAAMDGDLQDPPEVLAEMIDRLASGFDVAYGVRTKRKEALWKRAAYHAFYRGLRWVASVEIPLDSGDFCCMRRNVVDALKRLPERTRFLRGLRAWVGFAQVGVEYERAERYAGKPQYGLGALVRLAYDGVFAFSEIPIRFAQGLGFIAATLALSVAAYYAAWYFVNPARFPSGFATITVSIWFLAGVQLLFLGIVGEYIGRTLTETRGRPVALIREILGDDTHEDPDQR